MSMYYGWPGKKLIGDNQKKAATVCWTCCEERMLGEAGA